MLVLSRKSNQAIRIGDDIRVSIVRIDRNQVRLGIEAPGEVEVLREELILEMDERAAQAAWLRDDAVED